MGPHEEFLELCATTTAGELSADDQAKLDAHLPCAQTVRRAKSEYEAAANKRYGGARRRVWPDDEEGIDSSWSVGRQKKRFLKRLDKDRKIPIEPDAIGPIKRRPDSVSPTVLHKSGGGKIWMPFAAAILLALALGIAAYRTGVKRGTDAARILQPPCQKSPPVLLKNKPAMRAMSVRNG